MPHDRVEVEPERGRYGAAFPLDDFTDDVVANVTSMYGALHNCRVVVLRVWAGT